MSSDRRVGIDQPCDAQYGESHYLAIFAVSADLWRVFEIRGCKHEDACNKDCCGNRDTGSHLS